MHTMETSRQLPERPPAPIVLGRTAGVNVRGNVGRPRKGAPHDLPPEGK
jgi:hypothetical protein